MSFVQIAPTSRKNSDENMTPLINVVFLMLIFFMIAGVIRESDSRGIDYPRSISSTKLAKETVTLSIDSKQTIHTDAQVLSLELLPDYLKDYALNSQDAKQIFVILKVDGSVSADYLHQLLKSIRQAGLLKVQLLTTQPLTFVRTTKAEHTV